jgi:hypothetical protein
MQIMMASVIFASPNGDFENWLRGSLRLLARKFFK